MPECSSWEQGTDEKIKNSERSYKLAGGKKKREKGGKLQKREYLCEREIVFHKTSAQYKELKREITKLGDIPIQQIIKKNL